VYYRYTYDIHGNRTAFRSYSWNSETNAWVGNLQVDELYDEDNNRTEESYHNWNSVAQNWTNSWHYLNSYDEHGNQLEWIQNSWNSELNEWRYSSKQISHWSEKMFTISDTTTVTSTSTMPDPGKTTGSINDNFVVYPNPILDYATIKLPHEVEISHIDIINVYGKTVRRITEVQSNIVSIQRENLPNGIYFIRIHAEKTYLKKVIIM
jgi:hypothetical protein